MPLLILCKNFFQVQVCNKQAIVYESTSYPSNRGAKSAITFGLTHWLKQRTMNVLLGDFWATYLFVRDAIILWHLWR